VVIPLTPLAFAAEGDPIPPVGKRPYVALDPDQIGAAA
jgi:hypothetical protein